MHRSNPLSALVLIWLLIFNGVWAQAQEESGLPLAYWSFDNSLEESIEQRATTHQGDPLNYVGARFGEGLLFDAETQFLSVAGQGSDFAIKEGAGFTVSCWCSFGTKMGANGLELGGAFHVLAQGGGPNGWAIVTDPAREDVIFFTDVRAMHLSARSTTVDFDVDVWHHLVAVKYPDLAVPVLFLDGQARRTTGRTGGIGVIGTAPEVLRIGAGDPRVFGLWNGMIDDLAIWDRALSEAEIAKLWNSGDGMPVSTFIKGEGGNDLGSLEITSIRPGHLEGSVRLEWRGAGNQGADVFRSLDLQSWDLLARGETGEAFDDVKAPEEGEAFYRLRVSQAPE